MPASLCHRVVLVVLDGLRPDAIEAFDLSHLRALESMGASTRRATTVAPSVTAAAMGSLLTGVLPEMHGLTSDRFHIPRSREPIHLMPAVLRDAGLATSAFLAQPPLLFRRLARALAVRLGVSRPHFTGSTAADIVNASRQAIESQRSGLIVIHLPDADRAGHEDGWMSKQYADAARRLDVATGIVADMALRPAADTLLVVCADHGGGGAVANDHDSDHPLDRTIPIIMAGAGVVPGAGLEGALLVDIPTTVLAVLGVARPASYAGRVLQEAFRERAAAA